MPSEPRPKAEPLDVDRFQGSPAWDHRCSGPAGRCRPINILVAAVSGSLLPSLLSLLGVDPAIAGGVVLTTITDVAGFFSFLGLATLVYA